ncbi:MAG: hypothetical protein J2P37_03880 [Ktedonobacteraceae bacterium]|nr:hypothetical protein [Ktedonobacteraceae bacterium]MBO0789980.1 hypothetical protein [Ktedonobacteraceae bacterium]
MLSPRFVPREELKEALFTLRPVFARLTKYGPVTTSIVLSTPLSGEPIKQAATSREHNPNDHTNHER